MIRTRQELERRERDSLASYAQFSGDSAGRAVSEPRHPHRTEYQRDRARIIHSKAFRRLEYKTQVFLNGTGDHLRTRLTHTMEVASVSRSIASALGLNEDLAEAIALAHDLGHAPFGHSGEAMLNKLMAGHGGFEHNRQSLRIVEMIETKYPRFRGLNLSYEVLEGLRKHHRSYEAPESAGGGTYANPSLEAQIANLADEITYYSHDLDDGLDYALIDPGQLAGLEVWQETIEDVKSQFPDVSNDRLYSYAIRCLIDNQVSDVLRTSSECISRSSVITVVDVRGCMGSLIRYSAGRLKANRELRKFLYANLYYHPRVADANQRACRMLGRVFERYVDDPSLLGQDTAGRLAEEGIHRTVCDYLAGMTDRYLLEEYARLFPGEEP
jgi:dGTPase